MRNAGVVSSALAAIRFPDSGAPVADITPGILDEDDEVPTTTPRLGLDLPAVTLPALAGADARTRFRLGCETEAPCPGAARGWEAGKSLVCGLSRLVLFL